MLKAVSSEEETLRKKGEAGGRGGGGEQGFFSKQNILQPQKHLRKNSSLETKRENRALTVFSDRSAAVPAGLWGLFLLRGAGKRQGCLPASSRTLPWTAAQQPNHHQIWTATCTRFRARGRAATEHSFHSGLCGSCKNRWRWDCDGLQGTGDRHFKASRLTQLF